MTTMRFMILTSLIFCGAIFGFFYAWVCSTMWGLDQMDPAAAIAAMNAMNASVRNAVFFPAFFLTPVVLSITALVCWRQQHSKAASWIAIAAIIYILGAFVPTVLVNVPMNQALAKITPALLQGEAQQIWSDYSVKWQIWNIARTIASGLALIALGWGVLTTAQA